MRTLIRANLQYIGVKHLKEVSLVLRKNDLSEQVYSTHGPEHLYNVEFLLDVLDSLCEVLTVPGLFLPETFEAEYCMRCHGKPSKALNPTEQRVYKSVLSEFVVEGHLLKLAD